MDRRNFIGLSIVGAVAGLVAPSLALAKKKNKKKKAGGVFYTKKNPGRWSKKVAGHLPNIEIEKVDQEIKVKIVTAHGMEGYQHYIVKHVLLDHDYNFLDEKMFDPMVDKVPVSTFSLKNYKGKIYALSMCNKHDVWVNSVKV